MIFFIRLRRRWFSRRNYHRQIGVVDACQMQGEVRFDNAAYALIADGIGEIQRPILFIILAQSIIEFGGASSRLLRLREIESGDGVDDGAREHVEHDLRIGCLVNPPLTLFLT